MNRNSSRAVLRHTIALTTVLAFALTFTFADWVSAQTTPSPKRARRVSPTATVQRPTVPTPTPLPTAVPQTRLQIEHDPLACVTTVSPPLVEAKVRPGPDVSRSYVYWRASGTPYFYYTIMEGNVPELKGMIPRPLPETRAVDYFVQATDTASLSRKTPEYAPPVVQRSACKDRGPAVAAVGAGGAGLTIGLTDERQSPIPPGFNKADIAKVILLTGAVVGVAAAVVSATGGAAAGSGAGAAAAGSGAGAGAGAGAAGGAAVGGGISTTVLVVGGVAIAAGVGVAVASGSKSAATPTPTPTRTPTPTPVPNHFIEVDATWSGVGNVDVQLITSSQQVGQVVPASCEPTSSRTERVILTENSVVAGDYQVRLVGVSCGVGTPAQIVAVVTVITDTAPKCQSAFVNVPVGGTVDGCSFHVP